MKFVSIILTLSICYMCVLSQYNENELDLKDRILELSVSTPWDIIKSYNYPVENHNITTKDGYILSIQRLYGKNGIKSIRRPPVLLISGILTNTAMWVLEDNSLVYKLADLGYDVWMLNNRGIKYSTEHQYLDPESSAYWNFSFHEMGIYDAPNTIDYILETTNQKSLFCIGHSQGGAVLAIMLSKLPEYNSKIKLAIHLAPGVYVSNVLRPARMLAKSKMYENFEEFIDKYGYFGLFQNLGLFQAFWVNEICGRPTFVKWCAAIIEYSSGPNYDNLNFSHVPLIISQYPQGASVKQFAHYAQIVRSGEFVEYTQYKEFLSPSYKPKLYNFSAISVPTAVFYGRNDWIISPQDVQRFADQIPNLILKHVVEDNYFNHVDFVIGINRYEMVDRHIITMLQDY